MAANSNKRLKRSESITSDRFYFDANLDFSLLKWSNFLDYFVSQTGYDNPFPLLNQFLFKK